MKFHKGVLEFVHLSSYKLVSGSAVACGQSVQHSWMACAAATGLARGGRGPLVARPEDMESRCGTVARKEGR